MPKYSFKVPSHPSNQFYKYSSTYKRITVCFLWFLFTSEHGSETEKFWIELNRKKIQWLTSGRGQERDHPCIIYWVEWSLGSNHPVYILAVWSVNSVNLLRVGNVHAYISHLLVNLSNSHVRKSGGGRIYIHRQSRVTWWSGFHSTTILMCVTVGDIH